MNRRILQRSAKIMLPKDYLAYQSVRFFLHGRIQMHPECCSLDVKNKCWSEEMLEICGITRGSSLPKLYESYEVSRNCESRDCSRTWRIQMTVKVVAGAGDNAAAAVGTGTVGDGSCNISLGTCRNYSLFPVRNSV